MEIYPGAWLDVSSQRIHCFVHLIDLYRRVDHHAEIVETQPDDLNGVLQPQRIPDQDHLVQEAEDEDGEIGGNGQGSAWGVATPRFAPETLLELAKDKGLQAQANDGLQQGEQEERPRPEGGWHVHGSFALRFAEIDGM